MLLLPRFRSTLAATLLSLLAIGPAAAQRSNDAETVQNRNRDIAATVVNRTRTTLQVFYLAPPGDATWGDDRLGSEVLAAGRRFRVSLPAGQCRYDFRGTFEDGREITRFNLDLCRTPEIVIEPNARTAALPERRGPVLLYRVTNRTGEMIYTLRVVPTDSGEEGEDVLGASVLADQSSFTGRASSEPPCLYDVTATFESNRQPVTLQRQNLCRTREVVIDQTRAAETEATQQSSFTVRNRGRVPIMYLYVRQTGARGWGEDRLGSDILQGGNVWTVRVPEGRCEFDIRVRYEGDQEETRERQNVCENREIGFNGPSGNARRGREKSATANSAPDPAQNSAVVVVNRSQLPIEQINISSSRVSEWGENHLGTQVVAPNDRFTVRIQRDGQCDYDVRVQYRGGREERRMRQNICGESTEVVFAGPNSRMVDGGGPADGRLVRILNEGPVEVMELYLSPTNNTHWGDDRLGQHTLPRRYRYETRLDQSEGCRFDIRVVFRSGAAEERRDQDLCEKPELRFSRRHAAGTLVSTGTGFYVSATGHVLTNQHVVDGCSAIGIYRPNGERITLRMIAEDEENDLALLQQDNAETTPAPFRPANVPVRAGDRVVIVGWPARQELGHVNVTEGLVAGLRGMRGDERHFQYTAPTQAGNSGGPVFDEAGRVIGVVVAQLTGVGGDRQAQNINFGIRQEIVRRFLESNGVTASDDTAGTAVRPADILDRSLGSVLPLDCVG